MSDDLNFHELIGLVRQGDQEAAALLVRRFEPAIRRAIRFRLHDPLLRRTLDSMDVCQSVLCSFFVRAALGQYDLSTPEDLLRLLTTMARNKFLNQARRQRAVRRDGPLDPLDVHDHPIIENEPRPDQQAEARELLQEIHRRLSPEESQLVELRNQGLDWSAIADVVGGNVVALRQKFHRAVARVSREVGLEPEHE